MIAVLLVLALVGVWVVGFSVVRRSMRSEKPPLANRLLDLWGDRRSPWQFRRWK